MARKRNRKYLRGLQGFVLTRGKCRGGPLPEQGQGKKSKGMWLEQQNIGRRESNADAKIKQSEATAGEGKKKGLQQNQDSLKKKGLKQLRRKQKWRKETEENGKRKEILEETNVPRDISKSRNWTVTTAKEA